MGYLPDTMNGVVLDPETLEKEKQERAEREILRDAKRRSGKSKMVGEPKIICRRYAKN